MAKQTKVDGAIPRSNGSAWGARRRQAKASGRECVASEGPGEGGPEGGRPKGQAKGPVPKARSVRASRTGRQPVRDVRGGVTHPRAGLRPEPRTGAGHPGAPTKAVGGAQKRAQCTCWGAECPVRASAGIDKPGTRVRDAWEGWQRYAACATIPTEARLGMSLRLNGDLCCKHKMLDTLDSRHASCFWRALLMVLPVNEGRLLEFMRDTETWNLAIGVSPPEATKLCAMYGVPYAVHELTGRVVDHSAKGVDTRLPGIVDLVYDNRGRVARHYAPYARLTDAVVHTFRERVVKEPILLAVPPANIFEVLEDECSSDDEDVEVELPQSRQKGKQRKVRLLSPPPESETGARPADPDVATSSCHDAPAHVPRQGEGQQAKQEERQAPRDAQAAEVPPVVAHAAEAVAPPQPAPVGPPVAAVAAEVAPQAGAGGPPEGAPPVPGAVPPVAAVAAGAAPQAGAGGPPGGAPPVPVAGAPVAAVAVEAPPQAGAGPPPGGTPPVPGPVPGQVAGRVEVAVGPDGPAAPKAVVAKQSECPWVARAFGHALPPVMCHGPFGLQTLWSLGVGPVSSGAVRRSEQFALPAHKIACVTAVAAGICQIAVKLAASRFYRACRDKVVGWLWGMAPRPDRRLCGLAAAVMDGGILVGAPRALADLPRADFPSAGRACRQAARVLRDAGGASALWLLNALWKPAQVVTEAVESLELTQSWTEWASDRLPASLPLGWLWPPAKGLLMRLGGVVWKHRTAIGVCVGAAMCVVFSPSVQGIVRRYYDMVGPRLVEARLAVFESTTLRSGDYLYVLDRPTQIGDSHVLEGGALSLRDMSGVELHGLFYPLGVLKEVEANNGKYLVREVLPAHVSAFERLPYWRELTTARFFKPVPHKSLNWESVSALGTEKTPADEGKKRALFQYLRQLVPESSQGPFMEMRSLALAGQIESKPEVLARAACDLDRLVRENAVEALGYGRKVRCPKTCVSCGRDPPTGPYRWKHRVCVECAKALRTRGHVSLAGQHVQQNLRVPTCYPGIVQVAGEQYPAPKGKWDRVVVQDTRFNRETGASEPYSRVQRMDAPPNVPRAHGERGRKWVDAEKEDLAKLAGPLPFKPAFALAGIACSGARPMVSAQSDHNRFKALLGRVFQKPPPNPWGQGPHPGVWVFAERMKRAILPELDTEDMTLEDWLASMPARRRRVLSRAAELYKEGGLRKNDSAFTAFVKTELLPGFKQHLSQGYCLDDCLTDISEMLDRLIQGPGEKTHVVAGRKLKPKVAKLKELWACDQPLVYGSVGPEALHKLLQRLVEADGTYFCCDFSLFDRTHSDESWDFVESFYDKSDPDFAKVLRWWRRPTGSIGPFRYKGHTMNASGRDDTSLANAILNGFATTLSATAALFDIPMHLVDEEDVRKFQAVSVLSVAGDDSIGVLPRLSPERLRAFEAAFNANIAHFGFVAKLQTMQSVEDVVYLGMRPYRVAGRWFWGKTIGRATYKMGWVLDPENRDILAHITGVADMHLLCSAHVPVLSDLARKIVQLRAGARRTPVVQDPNRPWEWAQEGSLPYDGETLEQVARVYSRLSGVAVVASDVQSLIREIESITALPCVLDHWLWRLMVASDEL